MRGRGLIGAREVAICQREEVLVADGHAQAVRGQIPEGCRATADGLAVHDPVLVPAGRIHAGAPRSLVPVIAELRSDEQGEGRDMDQAVVAGRPPGVLGRESPAGTEVMPVGMVAQIAGPGLEHAHQAELAADAPAIEGACL